MNVLAHDIESGAENEIKSRERERKRKREQSVLFSFAGDEEGVRGGGGEERRERHSRAQKSVCERARVPRYQSFIGH